MGDFNSEWQKDGSLKRICSALDLKPWQPQDRQPTFNKLKKRLDWILIPNDFKFNDYRVLSDPLSDHQAVVADISL